MVESIVAIASVALILVVLLFVLELKLARTIHFVDEELQASERQLSDYRDFNRYLKRRERTEQLIRLDSVFGSLRYLRRYGVFLRKQLRARVELHAKRAEDLNVFLKRFVDEYVRREVESSNDFFMSRPFDRDQLEAIVKKDTYSLVLASAGSGKTRTLTARIAYLVKREADQHSILALAYTRTAEEEMRSRLKSEYGIVDADVRTFHSLGRELAKLSPNFRTGVANNQQQPEIMKEAGRPTPLRPVLC